MDTEAEIGAMQRQPRKSGAPRSWKRQEALSLSLRAIGVAWPCCHLDFGLLQNFERIHF